MNILRISKSLLNFQERGNKTKITRNQGRDFVSTPVSILALRGAMQTRIQVKNRAIYETLSSHSEFNLPPREKLLVSHLFPSTKGG